MAADETAMGLYESVLVEQGGIRLGERHLLRLARCGATGAEVEAAAAAMAAACRQHRGPVKLKVEVSPHGVSWHAGPATAHEPLALEPLVGYDHGDRLRELKALDRGWAEAARAAAIARGADDALLIDEHGRIGEAPSSNVFVVWPDGRIATPSVAGIVPGVTRQWVIERHDVEVRAMHVDELRDAEAVFLTTAGRGVVAVRRVGRVRFVTQHPLTSELHHQWKAVTPAVAATPRGAGEQRDLDTADPDL